MMRLGICVKPQILKLAPVYRRATRMEQNCLAAHKGNTSNTGAKDRIQVAVDTTAHIRVL